MDMTFEGWVKKFEKPLSRKSPLPLGGSSAHRTLNITETCLFFSQFTGGDCVREDWTSPNVDRAV